MNIHDATEVAYRNGYERGATDTAKKIFADLETYMDWFEGSDVILTREEFAELRKKYVEGEDE